KLTISYEESPSFRGYMQLGVENTGGKLDCREQIEYAVEYPDSATKMSWPPYERLKGTNPWPECQPSLQSTTLEYSRRVCEVADIIRDSLCLALQLQPNETLGPKFTHPTEVPHWVLKLISYPPANPNDKHTQQGVGAHTDTNFLTLVLQNDAHSGGTLQAFSQGEWMDVPSHYGSDVLICNLGEQAETWSRGYFLATPHRVVMNALKDSDGSNYRPCKDPRISAALFYNPVLSATMDPLSPELFDDNPNLSWERPKEYQQWRRENNAFITSVGENTFKSLARSHPEVFATHHPDLRVLEDGRIVRRES
ncbi:MAG: hypothetical protein SGARI_000577, partial [Bacillariaceae sp.]